jgi:SAM-dependent methyltransferase
MKYFRDKLINKLRWLILGPTENLIFSRIKGLAIKDFLGKRENQIHPEINETLRLIKTNVKVHVYTGKNQETDLGLLFTKHGSDKDTVHSYSWVYEQLLGVKDTPKILEIGIGSHNGFAYGGLPPGGSLKAWREAYPNAYLVGSDIDSQAISELDEIGFVVDQLNQDSLENLSSELEKLEKFDLIVDDGFHEPHANLRTYLTLYRFLKSDGFYVIEDVHESSIEFWRVIGEIIPGQLEIFDLRGQRPEIDCNILLVFRG